MKRKIAFCVLVVLISLFSAFILTARAGRMDNPFKISFEKDPLN
jgi:hypothetical protein